MTLEEALIEFKNQNRLCKALGIHRQSTYAWKRQGFIPYKHQWKIQQLTNNKLIATPEPEDSLPDNPTNELVEISVTIVSSEIVENDYNDIFSSKKQNHEDIKFKHYFNSKDAALKAMIGKLQEMLDEPLQANE
jgi:hypothetical protein